MIDVIKYKHGLGAPASQLPMFLNVMGMACVSLLVRRPANVAWASLPSWERHRIALLALIDAASGVCVMHGGCCCAFGGVMLPVQAPGCW